MGGKRESMQDEKRGVSRRTFVKEVGTGFVTASALSASMVSPSLTETHAQTASQVSGPEPVSIVLKINGIEHEVEIEPRETLLEVLRNRLDITGPKLVCDRGSCGACTVYIDGQTAYSCMTLAIEVQGAEITTIEGLASDDRLHPVQEAIVEADAIQCGFCTPGFAMSMAAVLDQNPSATFVEVQEGISGHICRCGTYAQMKHAIELAKKKMEGGGS